MDRSSLTLPAVLVIMDGFGIDQAGSKNAISRAFTPTLDSLFTKCPNTLLDASGLAVGLPEGQMGNSEVGHLNIGAGRVVYQELTRINKACEDGSLDQNEVISDVINKCISEGTTLHFFGLLSDGGVHSNNAHLYALLELAAKRGVPRVNVHCFMDGRDVPPKSGKSYIEELQEVIDKTCTESTSIKIASIHGRYYAMDRDTNWDRIQKAYDTLTICSNYVEMTPADAMQASYDNDVTDEFFIPCSFVQDGIADGDGIIFFNFRPDRAREITRSFVCRNFTQFKRSVWPRVNFVCLTEYDPEIPAPIAFPKTFPQNVLADVLSDSGLRQYHIAETEKYAHVTFFLNGGIEAPKDGEYRMLIPSPKVATYDLQPSMSAPEVTQNLCDAIRNDESDVYIVNFANCDMVGHTGIMTAAIEAVKTVDTCVARVLSALREKHGVAFVTADHGNADKMVAEDGSPHTAHTTAPVPFICVDFSGHKFKLKEERGALCNIVPTMLDAIGIEKPTEMDGESLLIR